MGIRRGFTLSEILVTLTVIGVVAAVTIPTLYKGTSKAQIGPSLSKFVNTFENACGSYLYTKNSVAITDEISSSDVKSKLGTELSKYMVLTESDSNISASSFSKPNDTKVTCSTSKGKYLLKSGATMCLSSADTATSGKTNGSYKGIVANVYVDINGAKGPNKAGIDVFKFYLDDTGFLIPYGSKAMVNLIYDNNSTSKDTANDCHSATVKGINKDFTCTGKYADAGWVTKN